MFERKRDVGNTAPLYSIGVTRTFLIIGLGNPGKEYDGTRHNIGFSVVDDFATANDFPGWVAKKDLKCHLNIASVAGSRIILCKPTTFMNLSGEAAKAVQQFYRIYNTETLAVYDELAIEFGSIRIRVGGSDAGHNGVKSLIQHFGDDFSRLRIGIGSDISRKSDANNFVLKPFSLKEKKDLPLVTKEASAIITEYIISRGQLPHETRTVIN